MTIRFKRSIEKLIKEKHKNFKLMVKAICGKRMIKGRYYIHSGHLT